jgi:hypothetical protein
LSEDRNYRSIQELLRAFYHGELISKPVESDFTIGTSPVTLTPGSNGIRISVLLSNTGTPNIAVGYNPALTITTGVLLITAGTFFSDWYYDGDLVSYPLTAIAAAAGGTLHMIERYLQGV